MVLVPSLVVLRNFRRKIILSSEVILYSNGTLQSGLQARYSFSRLVADGYRSRWVETVFYCLPKFRFIFFFFTLRGAPKYFEIDNRFCSVFVGIISQDKYEHKTNVYIRRLVRFRGKNSHEKYAKKKIFILTARS